MIRIIGSDNIKKTYHLLKIASSDKENALILCKNPNAMIGKAISYGFRGLSFASYDEFKNLDFSNKTVYIDELEKFLETAMNVKGYNFTLMN